MQSARFDGERVASQLNGASWFFQTRLRSNVLSRLKSGPDYTRLPLIAMENMKFGAGRIRMHDPFRCRRSLMAALLWANRGSVKVDSSVILYLR
jgi:hypothetical protein